MSREELATATCNGVPSCCAVRENATTQQDNMGAEGDEVVDTHHALDIHVGTKPDQQRHHGGHLLPHSQMEGTVLVLQRGCYERANMRTRAQNGGSRPPISTRVH